MVGVARVEERVAVALEQRLVRVMPLPFTPATGFGIWS
jgi:hypothetical protein